MTELTPDVFTLLANGVKEIESITGKELRCIRIDIEQCETHCFVQFVPTLVPAPISQCLPFEPAYRTETDIAALAQERHTADYGV